MNILKITGNHLSNTATKTLKISLDDESFKTLEWFVGTKIESYTTTVDEAILELSNWLSREDMIEIFKTKPDTIQFVKGKQVVIEK